MVTSVKESSVRNLTKTLAVVSLLAPVSGHSLGIGDIKLHSALNQNLSAEISLVVSAGEKASDIKVNLAPPDKFDEAGVPWASFLSKIKFETIVGANGSVIIKLSSREAVKEPFLDFLLEVSWPKGSLYREFTMLLDPPAAYKQATLSVLTHSESDKSEQVVIPQRQLKQGRQVSAERSLNGASEYGPTRKNDTLWKLAERAGRQEGVSVEQMMIAMYEKNPNAFYKENVHALLAGKTLKIPKREVVLKFSRKQALAEYSRQTKAWENRLAPAPIETASAKKESPDNQLTLVAPTKADVTENVIIAPENEQVTAKKKVDDAASKTIDKGVAGVASPVNDALQAKVAELEKQLAMMQRIVALKDQQLAVLQNSSQAKPVVQENPVQTTPGQTGVVNPAIQQKPGQPVSKPVIQPEPEATPSSNTYYLLVGAGAGTLSLFGWLWWQKRKHDGKTPGQRLFSSLNSSEATESKDLFFTPIEKESAKKAAEVGASSLFTEFTFGDLDTFDTDQGEIDPVSEADVYLAYGRYQQAEELMRDVIKDQPGRDECKLKLLEIFYSNENKQAFETYANELAEAGKKDDVEFWAKVTEMGSDICQDSTLFSSEASVFSPKEDIIVEKKTANLVESDDVEKNEVTDIKENNFSLSSFGESFNNEAIKEIPQTKDSLLNYDLTSFEDDIDDEQNNESIDFDLSTSATDDTVESNETDDTVASKTQEIRDNGEFELFAFDFGSTDTEIKESDESDLTVVDDDTVASKTQEIRDDGEFELFAFDLGSADTEIKESDESDLTVEDDTDESYQRTDFLTDKSSDLNYGFANDFFEGDHNHDFDVFDLADMDQLETKLDLAKAYIDMNDADAAKDMAWEVLEKGTEEQKKIAQALLDDLK
jgi:pilus assembly protein FimV